MANLDILERESLVPRGRELEGELMDALAPLADHDAVKELRGGLGLAAAVELHPDVIARVPGAVGRFTRAVRRRACCCARRRRASRSARRCRRARAPGRDRRRAAAGLDVVAGVAA